MKVPTKLAALLVPGDVIGYRGEWRTVRETAGARGPMGGLAVVVTWAEGDSARFPAGDELVVRDSAAPPTGTQDAPGSPARLGT
ncbi:hypothetical protein FNX48_008840 [Streptomyces sp. IF17]|nr:hypothetical protein [Streptomyces alkaliphilus]MQS07273.1 hypothetical protein [Streptomyces alkaliphilus]